MRILCLCFVLPYQMLVEAVCNIEKLEHSYMSLGDYSSDRNETLQSNLSI
jgi:hypothetical protein